MPNAHDLADRFDEYLCQTHLPRNTRVTYVVAIRHFGRWLAQRPHYGDAFVDPEVRDKALAEYWPQLLELYHPSSVLVARHALMRMFTWLELPPGRFPDRPTPGPAYTYHYGAGTSITRRDGVPFKAKVRCADGRLRTTERLSEATDYGHCPAQVSLYAGARRFKVSGVVLLETLAGSLIETPEDPFVVKFEAHEHLSNAAVLGYGLWRPDPQEQ